MVPAIRVPRRAQFAAVAAVAALALTACTPDEPAPTPSTSAPTEPVVTAAPSESQSAAPAPMAIGELASVPLTVADGVDPGPAQGRSVNLPEGWSAEVWTAIPDARLAAWTPDGRLLVSSGDFGVVHVLTPGQGGEAPASSVMLDGLRSPQGLAFTDDGATLVVGESDRLVAYDYAAGVASNPRVILDGLPSNGHGAKAVAISEGTVYYSLGSRSNREPAEREANPERAAVGAVGLDGSGNRVFARGVRNGFALDFAPDGTLFVAVNQMDNLPYPFQDDSGRFGEVFTEFVNDNPVEQLTRLTDGIDLGWPLCVPDSRDGVTDVPYVPDAEFNADGSRLDCGALPATQVGLPAHSAPLGMTFTHDTALADVLGAGALVGAHGSWNRTPPQEPYVAFAPWDDATATLGAAQYLMTGFQDDGGARWGRPVMPVVGPDGSVYVTDDHAGLVYRLTPGP
ncbi:PQQ-dependent sugar dehydrogenase [Demequina zhanjiangensis]|uniref:Pyrroloquinoline quinone-dependent pyranose dehydrogenase beta-propeller domain-containing protein n=1 Tax=Demequina zhanjiangensis TaxID=3051659 RepID=A0ABT8G1K4_9MICO|nr:hypothetical protein [Demequina sp. SYSU T00b26]MDN4473016.1 hypothetical protein [Demequina sp. SYSU T00b26]